MTWNRGYSTDVRPMRKRRGVYTTATARRLCRRQAYRTALTRTREYAADVAWGVGMFALTVTAATAFVLTAGWLYFP